MTWREKAAPIIAAVLQETRGKSEKEIRQALTDAYPFGPRQYYPYAIWCEEVRKQLGLPFYKYKNKRQRAAELAAQPDPNQTELFT